MSERIYQCKYCGTRILRKQTVPENAGPCPSCGRQEWAEIRAFGGQSKRDQSWLVDFFRAIERDQGPVRWQ